MSLATNDVVERASLPDQIYERLRHQLMSARFQPHERLKIRDIAKTMGTSETPVREALLRLVHDGALEMKSGYYIRVRRVNFAEYMEIRDLRLRLEPLAAERALPNLSDAMIDELAACHRKLIAAEKKRDYPEALLQNYYFHLGIYRRSGMPHLTGILEKLWIQIGPILNYLYPHGHPTYDGPHQHEIVLRAMRDRDVDALCRAVKDDLIEGGRNFVRFLQELEADESRRPEAKEP